MAETVKTYTEEEVTQYKQQIEALQNDVAVLKELVIRQAVQINFPNGGNR